MEKREAIQHFGSVIKLAAALGLSRQAIYLWPERVPDLYQYKLHHMSGGVLPLSDQQAERNQ